MATTYETIFQRYDRRAREADVPRQTDYALNWFRETIRKDKKVSQERVATDARRLGRGVNFAPGNMFTYVYDPKYKDKLPFYDVYPLIVVVEKTKTGWYGINVHYLPPILRAALFKDIGYRNKDPKRVAEALARNPLTSACLKQYLASHVVSRPVGIPKEEWEIAIQLPFEGFKKAEPTQVWGNSRVRIAKRRR